MAIDLCLLGFVAERFVRLWPRPMVHALPQGVLLGEGGELARLWLEPAVRLERA